MSPLSSLSVAFIGDGPEDAAFAGSGSPLYVILFDPDDPVRIFIPSFGPGCTAAARKDGAEVVSGSVQGRRPWDYISTDWVERAHPDMTADLAFVRGLIADHLKGNSHGTA